MRRVRNRLVQPHSLQELEAALLQEWENIPMRTVSSLIHSVNKRCAAVLAANDVHFVGFFTLTPSLLNDPLWTQDTVVVKCEL